MANKVKVELNRNAVRNQLLKSGEMQQICLEHAKRIAARCGKGYEAEPYSGPHRVNAAVNAKTYEARLDNSRHNTILKAVGGG